MIPSDLAARLRMMSEASFFDSEPPIQGTARVRELQARLPQLLPGQQFTASIQRPLPDGTFQAVVAGREYTLALNQSVKAGDTLELVVTRNTAGTVFAELANPASAANANASQSQLSPAGRLISFLLTGQPTPQAAQLAEGKPLINTPPTATNAAQTLAPALRNAVSQSGLFFESHQQKWLSGKADMVSLLREPQGRFSPALQVADPAAAFKLPPGVTPAMLAAAAAGAVPGAAAPTTPGGGLAGTLAGVLLGVGLGGEGSGGEGSPLRATPGGSGQGAEQAAGRAAAQRGAEAEAALRLAESSQSSARQTSVPERLVPVVHQQLDAMATQTYVLQGQAWPGQMFELEIEDPDEGDQEGESGNQDWKTTLRLTLPRLGSVEAQIQLDKSGIALRLSADDADTVETLLTERESLATALEAANLPLTGFRVSLREPPSVEPQANTTGTGGPGMDAKKEGTGDDRA